MSFGVITTRTEGETTMAERNGTNWLVVAAGAAVALGAWSLLRRAARFDFRGKTVLITGGSRGLGLVLGREFGGRGARVALCARNAEDLTEAVHDLSGRGIPAAGFLCDLTDRAAAEGMVDAVRREFGRVDVLVNNAGTIQVGPVDTMTYQDYDECMKIHFWGTLHPILAVLPEMKERREGRIVNVTSIGGKVAVAHLVPYSASKFAQVGLSEGLRAELARDGIVVTTIVPWLMTTGSPKNALFKGHNKLEYAWFDVLDSLPGLAVAAEDAARQIADACARGDAEHFVGLPAQLAAWFHGLFPGLTADVMAAVNQMLPGPGGIGAERRLGRDSESVLAPSLLTATTEAAAKRNNEE